MCIMSAAARESWLRKAATRIEVSQTKLFARVVAGVQYLVYEMAIDTSSDVAMILPLPVAQVADDAIEFLDFSRAQGLFRELANLFPSHDLFELGIPRGAPIPQGRPLVVHSVGSFEASYVPTLADMDRLDPRFRIADTIWKALPQYTNAGFAVFKLKPGKQTIHPMAMKFATAEPSSIFFPTVHVHDGKLHDTARFDHALYFQTSTTPVAHAPDRSTTIDRSTQPPPPSPTIANAHGAVSVLDPVYRVELRGTMSNADTRIAI